MTTRHAPMPDLSVTPVDGLIDEPRRIIVSGLAPDELVTISALTRRSAGAFWDSQATFMADAQSVVDLTRDAPVGGDYAEVSAMGLFWSQHPTDNMGTEVFPDDVMQPLPTTLRLETADGRRAEARLFQRFAAPGVTRREIREEGLVGALFTPAGPGPHPAVVVLNGSSGGINEARGALYASRGYQAFALGYFKAPGLSPFITETPLEYFETGLRWVRRELRPRSGFVAVSGQSRGGELVLLLGATFPGLVSAVIAYVPGALVHGAQGAGDPARGGWHGATWTRGGAPIPHLWQDNSAVNWHPWNGDAPPNRHHSVFFEGLKDHALAERARIPVEKIAGPVLLISGRDDRAWPSSLYSRMVVSTLLRQEHPFPVRHLDFDDAGHSINLPFVPATQLSRAHPVSKVPFTSGGTPSGNARADNGSWRGVLAFLDEITGHQPTDPSPLSCTTTEPFERKMNMATKEHLEGQWREWRHAHVASMFRPYGWTSLVAQYWLEETDRDIRFEMLPGAWSVENGKVIFTPPASGPTLSVNGEYPAGPVEIIPGRNQTYGHGDSVPVYFGVNEVETVVRTNHDGQRLYAVRVRDPRRATRPEDAGVTAFDYDPAWRIPGVYTPAARVDFEAETVEAGVRETTPRMGAFTFELNGRVHDLVLIGKDTPTGIQPVAHFRDKTNGPVTYGAGRVVELQFADDEGRRIDWIDFNYAVALPCAFTNFVTCPLVPPENRLDFEVLAGEKRPVQTVARTMTYQRRADAV